MPGKRKETMDIRELLRYIQHGESDRAVEKATGVNRKTVARYREWATEQGLLEEALPPLGELHRLLKETMNTTPPPQNTSSVEPYRELVTALRERGVEMAAIHQRLIEQGYTGSYSSVRRFVRKLEPVTPEAMVRVETLPGEEGQVDFGFAGELVDPETGELRRAWAFVMALSWSRHQYVEFVFNQKLETWLRLHRNAFSFFGGYMRNRQIWNVQWRRFDKDRRVAYTELTQGERGESVVPAAAFPRFLVVGVATHREDRIHHDRTSPSCFWRRSGSSPRAAAA